LGTERCPSGLRSTLGKRVCVVRRTAGSNPALSAIPNVRWEGEDDLTHRKEGALEIAAAILVLFAAMLDARISFAIAAAALIGFGLYHLLKKT
jgi:hypothetical protein